MILGARLKLMLCVMLFWYAFLQKLFSTFVHNVDEFNNHAQVIGRILSRRKALVDGKTLVL